MTAPITTDFTCVPAVEPSPPSFPGDLEGVTVWFDFPHAGVDRPRTQGITVGLGKQKLVDRLVKAAEDGAVVRNPEVLTDINGETYVGFTCAVLGRYLDADLKKLGF